jgi:uncharacterized membrane protein YraQ (UPF0718 family)
MTTEKSYTGWYFLMAVIWIYVIVFFLKPDSIIPGLQFFIQILKKLIPVFLLVFILMALTNYLISPKKLVKWMGKGSGAKGWLIAILTGILSTGPIYMWYPLLNELQEKGVRNALIAAFLYNRAIKIPLLPMLILYFGITYAIILMAVMVVISIFQGIAIEKLTGVGK